MDALHKPDHELVARFAQPPSRSDDVIKGILQELGTCLKQNHAPFPWK
jgi:hypothetical protein